MTNDLERTLFVQRAQCLPLTIADHDAEAGSRVGGRPPAAVKRWPRCPVTGAPMLYLLTLESDALGPGALSLFCSPDAGARAAARRPLDPPTIVGLHHERSPRVATAESDAPSAFGGRALLVGAPADDVDPDEPSEPFPCSKIGGKPSTFQSEAHVEALEQGGHGFVAQWVEFDYPKDDDFPKFYFGAGALFVYARLTEEGGFDLGSVRCFWEK
ncbi:hypothetical protein [Sorangium sp. So ce1097]|uniref:hypothetical protein n=1 Tax=Sorangium sp. So ce1097 TaxID=3133330 RepID=UPI003F603F96